jgi:hypothetical protein
MPHQLGGRVSQKDDNGVRKFGYIVESLPESRWLVVFDHDSAHAVAVHSIKMKCEKGKPLTAEAAAQLKQSSTFHTGRMHGVSLRAQTNQAATNTNSNRGATSQGTTDTNQAGATNTNSTNQGTSDQANNNQAGTTQPAGNQNASNTSGSLDNRGAQSMDIESEEENNDDDDADDDGQSEDLNRSREATIDGDEEENVDMSGRNILWASAREFANDNARSHTYRTEKTAAMGTTVNVKGKIWTVIDENLPEYNMARSANDYSTIGVCGYRFSIYSEPPSRSSEHILQLFLHMFPGSWVECVRRLNDAIRRRHEDYAVLRGGKHFAFITLNEFLIFWGIILKARVEGIKGGNLWPKKEDLISETEKPVPNMEPFMKKYRFEGIKSLMKEMWADRAVQNEDPWWPVAFLIDGFNNQRKAVVCASATKIIDESMSSFRPRTTASADCPHLSYILRKPEPLGVELKVVSCGMTGIMLHLEIQKGKGPMADTKYTSEYGASAACTLRGAAGTKGSGRAQSVLERVTETVYGDSWFSSVRTCTALSRELDMNYLGIVKTAHKNYPKAYLEDKMKRWPAGSVLVLKSKIDDVDLLAVGYKYNSTKVICFVMKKDCGDFSAGKPYEARWKDDNGNMAMREIFRPSCVSNYFEHSNTIDTHNHLRQGILKLEKHWITQSIWQRLPITVIGMTVVDSMKALKHHVHLNNRYKNMTMEQFTEILAYQLLHNKKPKEFPVVVPMYIAPSTPLENHLEGIQLASTNYTTGFTPLSTLTSSIRDSESGYSHQLTKTVETMVDKSLNRGVRCKRERCCFQTSESNGGLVHKKRCGKLTSFFCSHPVCRSKSMWFCEPCFKKHNPSDHDEQLPNGNREYDTDGSAN